MPDENHMLKAISWGLLYGSLSSVVVVGVIMGWFYFYYFEKH